MGAVTALGVTHFPPLALADDHMADVFKWALRDPDLPADRRDAASWTDLLREEWGDDEGLQAAQSHREAMRLQFERILDELKQFGPDVIMIWGDDQYELFNEECVPAFAVCAFEDLSTQLWQRPFYKGRPNAWEEVPDTIYPIRGHREAAKHLVDGLLERGVDMAYSYRPAAGRPMPAAFANTIRYIDWTGKGLPYPAVFLSVNCYGRRLVANKGGLAYLSAVPRGEGADPPAPSPSRCFDVGAAVAEVCAASPWRVALIASSSWSHAFLNEASHFLLPDVQRDRELYQLLNDEKLASWRDVTLDEVERAGQHEMLNWFCLAGAVDRLGLRLKWSEILETDLFTSTKVFAAYEPMEAH